MNTTEEIWKPIKGYENYMVSSLGRIKSLNYNHTGKEKIIKSRKVKDYLMVTLVRNKNAKQYSIHRLVAETFIHNPNNLPLVHHKDENKHNNCVNNLCWCTNKFNVTYSSGKPIKCLDLKTKEETIFPSIIESSRQLNIPRSSIINNILYYKVPYKNRYIFSLVS